MFVYCVLTYAILTLCAQSHAVGIYNVTFDGYERWTPPGQQGNELFCPDHCSTYKHPERCCSCDAKRCWEIDAEACGVTIGQIHIEYTDFYGNAKIVKDPSDNATFYELTHQYGHLRYIPNNICDWANQTVTVDFSNNVLIDITEIKCMTKLDKLILDDNLITYVDNTTFSDMEQLRVLSLKSNPLEKLDPNTISIAQGNILTVDISFTELETVDVTNLYITGPFCSLSYEGSSIESTTNVLNFTVGENTKLGPGSTNLNKTSMTSFANFSQIGIHDFADVSKYISGTFYLDETSIHCDCNLYPYFDELGQAIYDLWGNLYGGFVCSAPERMAGLDVVELFEQGRTDELVCETFVNCPRYCKCLDKPSDDVIIVNCSWTGKEELPSDMPVGQWQNNNIDLLLEGNNIVTLENRNYLNRLTHLDLTDNDIRHITDGFAKNMPVMLTIEMENQNLENLPTYFASKYPGNFKFGKTPILCNCENVWIGNWMRFNEINNVILCKTGTTVLDSSLITSDYLECNAVEPPHWSVYFVSACIAIAIIAAVAWMSYFYRYELFLIKRKYINNRKYQPMDYDVFLSFCADNTDVFEWVFKTLRPALQAEGYNVFCPWFDVGYGEDRNLSVAISIRKSRHHVVCLCDQYQEESNSIGDYNTVWKDFASDSSKQITVVNYAPLSAKSIKDKRIRAFRRIRDDINYKESSSKLIQRLKKRLGPPCVERKNNHNHPIGQNRAKFDGVRIERVKPQLRKQVAPPLPNVCD